MITVRRYLPEDRAAVAAVFFRAVRDGTAGAYSQAQREDWAKEPEPDWTRVDPRNGQFTWVSESDGQITGFMAMTPRGYLDMALVLPEVMGKGHAAAIYDALFAHAKATGLQRMTVHASTFSRRFLEKRGWLVDEVEDFVSSGGVHFERFVMSIDLGGRS
jgi:putative acetyltransferase